MLNAPIEGKPLSGKSGWLPLPDLSKAAHDVGFIDYRVIDQMPLVERYRGKLVKSLYLSCLETRLRSTFRDRAGAFNPNWQQDP